MSVKYITCITEMSNYSDYSSGSSDEEATKTKNTMADISHKLTLQVSPIMKLVVIRKSLNLQYLLVILIIQTLRWLNAKKIPTTIIFCMMDIDLGYS